MNEALSQTPPPPPLTPPPMLPVVPVPQTLPKNPGAAGALSLLPGMGHVYLGLYQRGIAYFAVWVLVISFLHRHGGSPLGLLIPFWMLFVMIDAVRQAKAINMTGAPESSFIQNEKAMKADGGLTMGILLILLGLFFLVERFVNIDLSFLLDWWPLFLVAFGSWQVFLYVQDRKRRDEAATAASREAANQELEKPI